VTDGGGEVAFVDDASIEAGDPIWRRVSPGQWTYNHNTGQVQPKSGLFQYNKDPDTGQKHPMSIALGKGITPDAAIAGKPAGTKLVGWTAEYVRSLALGICRHDLLNEVNHGLVFHLEKDKEGKRKTSFPGSVQAKLAGTAAGIIALSPEETEEARARTAA
jgi:hypothetical protein